MNLIKPDWHAPANVHAFMTTRTGGVSTGAYDSLNPASHVGDDAANVLQNRALIRAHVPNEPLWLNQTHSINVRTDTQHPAEADAVVLTQAGQVGVVMTADCLPVIFASGDGKIIGAAHAGWRGLVDGVLEQTLFIMQQHGAVLSEVHAWFGAAIGATKFEVGQDVLDEFIAKTAGDVTPFFQPQDDKYLADIYGLAHLRLNALGVTKISGGTHCTVSEPETFYSYRRDKITGRMATLIWMDV